MGKMKSMFLKKAASIVASSMLVFTIWGMPAGVIPLVQHVSAEETKYFTLENYSGYINPDGKTMSLQTCYTETWDNYPKELTLPTTLNYQGQEYKVTKLANEFRVNNEITKIIVPEGMEEIGTWFCGENRKINSISLPASLRVITPGAFYMWELGQSLTSVTIAEGNTLYNSIGNAIYTEDGKTLVAAPCAKGKYKIKTGVKTVGAFCFYGNRRVTKVTVPKGVKTIGESAFSTMEKSLKEVILPNTVTSLGNSAFAYCTGLTKVDIPKVTKISPGAFYYTGLKSIAVPEGVEEIGAMAFAYCTNRNEISLPSTVRKIDMTAFDMTEEHSPEFESKLKPSAVTISNKNKHYKMEKGALLSKDGKTFYKLLASASTYKIPKSVKTIEKGAFSNNNQIDKVVIRKGITKIPDSAFAFSTVSQVELPEGITCIGNYAFKQTKIQYITLPNGVKTIGTGAFLWGYLRYLTVPDSVTSIGDKAFTPEYGIVQVHFLGKMPPTIGICPQVDEEGGVKVIIPKGTKEAYEKALAVKNSKYSLEILDSESKKVYVESDCYARMTIKRINNDNIYNYSFSLNGKDYSKKNVFELLTPKKTYTVYAKKGSQVIKTKVQVGSLITYIGNSEGKKASESDKNYITIGGYDDFHEGYEYKLDDGKWKKLGGYHAFSNLKAGKHTLFRRKKSNASKNTNKVVKETFTIS